MYLANRYSRPPVYASAACVLTLLSLGGGVAQKPAEPTLKLVHTLKGHDAVAYHLVYSPDNVFLATASFDRTVKLWDPAAGKEIKTLGGPQGHQNLVMHLAFTPDSRTLFSAAADNTLKAWDVPARGPLREFLQHGGEVFTTALSPDGTKLATGCADGKVRLWNPADGKLLLTLEGHGQPVRGVAFSANNQLLASVGDDGTLRLWSAADGKPLGYVQADVSRGAVFNPNNQAVYTAGADGCVRFWTVPFPPSRTLAATHETPVLRLAYTTDGNRVVCASSDAKGVTIRVNNAVSGALERMLPPVQGEVVELRSSGPLVAAVVGGGPEAKAAQAGHEVRFWNVADGADRGAVVWPAGQYSRTLALNAQGTQFATGDAQGVLRVGAVPAKPPVSIPLPDVLTASFAARDGKRLYTGHSDGLVRGWNLANNQNDQQYKGLAAPVTALTVSGNGQIVVAGGKDGSIRIWQQGGPPEGVGFTAHAGPVISLDLDSAGTRLVSGGSDGAVRAWTVAGADARSATLAVGPTRASLSGDGKWLLVHGTATAGFEAQLFNLADASKPAFRHASKLAIVASALLPAVGNAPPALAIATDDQFLERVGGPDKPLKSDKLPGVPTALAADAAGKQLAVGFRDGSICLYGAAKLDLLRHLPPSHSAAVSGLAFSADGVRLVSAGVDGIAVVWNLADGKPAHRLKTPEPIAALAVNRDATRVAVGGEKGLVLWTATATATETTLLNVPGVRSLTFNSDASRLAVASADKKLFIYGPDSALIESIDQAAPVVFAGFLADGKQHVALGADRTLRFSSSRQQWAVEKLGPTVKAVFTPKGDQLIVQTAANTLGIFSAADGKPSRNLDLGPEPIRDFALSADGNRLVLLTANRLSLYQFADGKQQYAVSLADAKAAVETVQLGLSVDGTLAAVVVRSAEAPIRVYDLNAGLELQALPGHEGATARAAVLLPARTVLSVGSDKTARLQEIAVQRVFKGHEGRVSSLAYHPNGGQLFSAGADGFVRQWDLAAVKELRRFGDGKQADTVLALSREANPTRLAVGHAKGFRVWSLTDGKLLLDVATSHAVVSLSFNADGTRLAVAGSVDRADVYELASGRIAQSMPAAKATQGETIAFHPTNASLLALAADRTVAVHTLAAGRVVKVHDQPINGLAITPNASHLLTAGDDGTVRFVNLASGAVERTIPVHKGKVWSVAVARNSLLLAVGGDDRQLRLFTLTDGKEIKAMENPAAVRSVAISPNNQLALAACADGSVLVWNVNFQPGQPPPPAFGETLATFRHGAAALEGVFAADNATFFTASADKSARAWKIASDAPTRNLTGHANIVDCVALNKDGSLAASSSHDGTVRIWETGSGKLVRTINAFTTPAVSAVYTVAWSPDGKQLVAGSLAGAIRIFDATNGNQLREMKGHDEKTAPQGHREGVFTVLWSDDGKLIYSSGSDGTIKVWNAADGAFVRHFLDPALSSPKDTSKSDRAHEDWINHMKFTPDGKRLVSVGNAGWLKVWDAAKGTPMFKQKLSQELHAVAFPSDGRHLATANHDGTVWVFQMPATLSSPP